MKILQILPSMELNHVARSTLDIAKALVKADHTSVVVSNGGSLVSRLERDGSKHISLPVHQKKLSALWQVKALREVILAEQPDIIHVRARMPAWITRLALRGMDENDRPKVVSTIHSIYPVSRYSQVMTEAECVICVSEFVAEHIKANFPHVPIDKIKRVYRGVDSKSFPYRYQPSVHWWNGVLAEFPQLDNKVWLTLPGTVSQSRGHQWLLDILGNIKKEHPNAHAVIVGDPKDPKSPYFEDLKMRIDSLGLNEHVTFTGWRDDIRDWLAASNIVFSLIYKPIAYSQTVMESLSLGTPVLAWNHGGVAETLSNLYPEGLLEPEDGLALCTKVKQLLEEPETPKKPESFLLKQMNCEILAIYREVLGYSNISTKPYREHNSPQL